MASPVSSEPSLRAFEPSSMPQPTPTTLDSQAAINQLAAQARISQLAAQLRLRLSYAGYKAQNKLSSVPFSTLEKQLEDDSATPKRASPVLLLDPLSLDKTLSDTQLMPPPPAPATSLFSSLLDVDIDTRPTKRQKTDAVGSARAIGPSPAGFTQGNPDIKVNGHRHHSTSGKPRSKGSSSSPKKRQKKDSMSDREQLAAKTLASLLVAKSPRSSTKAPSELSFTTDGGNEQKGKSIRRAPSSVSSIDAAMADTTLSVSGDTVPEGSTSGVDTVPGSPVISTAQRERDSAELLLLLATSPSPARNSRRGPPNPVNRTLAGNGTVEPRALFAEGSSNSDSTKQDDASESNKDSNDASGSASKRTPSLLLPAPPSPSKKTNKTPEDKSNFQPSHAMPLFPSSSTSKSSGLQAPFTPVGTLALHTASNTTNFGSASGGFGSGFAMAMNSLGPSTPGPSGFNMADYINFTPTPSAPYSPAPKSKAQAAASEKGVGPSSTVGDPPTKRMDTNAKGSTPESDAVSVASGEKPSDKA